jgi:hypothetical protein
MAALTFLLPNRKLRQHLYLPHANEIPPGDYEPLLFDFTATGPQGQLGAFATLELSHRMNTNWLLWGITARSQDSAGNANSPYQVQIVHSHMSGVRELIAKPVPGQLVLGTAQLATILKSPYLLEPGDQLTFVVINQAVDGANNPIAADVQICAHGVRL